MPPIWATYRASNSSSNSSSCRGSRRASRRTITMRPVPAPWRHCGALCWDTCSASSRPTGIDSVLWLRKCSRWQCQCQCLIGSPAWTCMRSRPIRPRRRTMQWTSCRRAGMWYPELRIYRCVCYWYDAERKVKAKVSRGRRHRVLFKWEFGSEECRSWQAVNEVNLL